MNYFWMEPDFKLDKVQNISSWLLVLALRVVSGIIVNLLEVLDEVSGEPCQEFRY